MLRKAVNFSCYLNVDAPYVKEGRLFSCYLNVDAFYVKKDLQFSVLP